MLNIKKGHKLCLKCKESYKTKCTSPQCKYTIQTYKTQSKYMKLKTIEYLKENKIEFYLCKICGQIVDKNHFDTEEHIDKFNEVCKIDIKKCFKDAFLTINCKFLDTRYNYVYHDLYFKKTIKEIILKNIDVNKYYKSYILKKLRLDFNEDKESKYYSQRFNSNNVLKDIENIEKIEKNDDIIQPYLIKNSSEDYNYNLEKMYIDMDDVLLLESGLSIILFNTIGCQIKLAQCQLIKGSSFKNIPKIFYNSKIINIIQNKDKKCFLYCYIRKYLNAVTSHSNRVSRIDQEYENKLDNELNYNFDDIKIKDLPKIEDLLETNIYVYSCNKNLKEKIPIFKSDKNHEKFLNLLLFENHYMLIKNIDRFFYPNVKNKSFFCRSCCNTFFSEKKYNEHLQFCNSNNTQILMPSVKKYLEFYNWQNTIKNNFICYADIESYMLFNDNKYNHYHLMSGYYLDCVDKKYSKKVQLFNELEDFRDSLTNELDYVEKINKTILNYEIDMTTFDQKKYDETIICPYCKYKFNDVNRKVIHHNHLLRRII